MTAEEKREYEIAGGDPQPQASDKPRSYALPVPGKQRVMHFTAAALDFFKNEAREGYILSGCNLSAAYAYAALRAKEKFVQRDGVFDLPVLSPAAAYLKGQLPLIEDTPAVGRQPRTDAAPPSQRQSAWSADGASAARAVREHVHVNAPANSFTGGGGMPTLVSDLDAQMSQRSNLGAFVQVRSPGGPFETPSKNDIEDLLRNPHLRSEFEYLFGPAEQYLSPDQLARLPPRVADPRTMPEPDRGRMQQSPIGGYFSDQDGNRPPQGIFQSGNGTWGMPDAAPGKTLPLDFGRMPTKQGPRPYSSGVYDPFGLYRSYPGQKRKRHQGVDVIAPVGTPVYATASGIAKVRNGGPLGTVVAIEHSDKTTSLFCHLDAVTVHDGAQVLAGDVIGMTGVSGNPNPGAPHLHWEVIETNPSAPGGVDLTLGRRTLDPIEWLRRPDWYRGSALPNQR